MDKTMSGIIKRMQNDIPAKYNADVGSYIYDVLAPTAFEIEKAYALIDTNLRKTLVASATGADLDSVLGQFGFERKRATYASGYVTVAGVDGAALNIGDLVAKGKVLYAVQGSASIVNGKAVVNITAQSPGSSGNARPGEVNYFPVVLSGILSVTNEGDIIGGTDAESDEEYRSRYYYFLDNPVTTGNKYEYEQWAREIDGVGAAKCYPLWNGAGTVKVVITTADMQPAPDELIETVKTNIEDKRPVGANVTVKSAGTVTINVTAKVSHSAAYTLENISARFSDALTDYFKAVGFGGDVIPYTKVGAILQETDGVNYYSELRVNEGANNIAVGDGNLAVLGGVSLE